MTLKCHLKSDTAALKSGAAARPVGWAAPKVYFSGLIGHAMDSPRVCTVVFVVEGDVELLNHTHYQSQQVF